MSQALPADLRAAAALGGEMGRRFAELDWTAHPLGDPAGWPGAVRAMAVAALTSRFPTVLFLGDELRLVYNDGYIPMLGDKHPAALGRPGAEVWWDIWDVVGPMLQGVARSGVATWSDDLKLLLVNGGRREEHYFTFSYSPIMAGDGRVEGVFCAVTETTERVLGERRLRVLNAMGSALLDAKSADAAQAAAVNVCVTDDADLPFAAIYHTEGPLAEARPYRVTAGLDGLLPGSLGPLLGGASTDGDGGYLTSDLPARLPGLGDRFGVDRCPEQALVLPVSRAGDGEPTAVLVLGLNPCCRLDEQYRGFCRLLADKVAAALAMVRAYEDERHRAEALAELDRAKTAFLANVSHEFRTPLTLMLGPLDDLIAAAAADGELAGRLTGVRRSTRRLLRLVNSLLDFSQVEAGRATPQLAVTDAGALTAELASSFAEVCRLAGIALVTDCQPAWARVDPGMWETIVLNLVSNAVKYTLAGSVTVRSGPAADGGIEMTVADTGAGIPAGDLPHVFDRFYRTISTAGRSAEGSGIGLALVKSLVDMHGGTITIDSTPGTGTTVTVWLPQATPAGRALDTGHVTAATGGIAGPAGTTDIYVDEAMQWLALGSDVSQARPGEHTVAGRVPGRRLVLIADDNADMRGYLARVLGARWEVATAADGEQALELARRLRPDLLVTDVMMPTLDGFGLLKAIRADPGLAPLPVVLLSARAGVEAAGEGLAAGADDYLAKPFSSADLLSRVAARLEAVSRDSSRRDGPPGRRNQALGRLGTALAAARSVAQAVRAVLASPECCLGATGVAVGMLDDSGRTLRTICYGDIHDETTGRYQRVDMAAPAPIAEVIRTGAPVVVPDTSPAGPGPWQLAAGAAPVTRACVLHPLRAAGDAVIGAIGLSWPQPRRFSPDEVEVTRQAAAMLGRALGRLAAAEREHQIAVTLQEQLLDLGTGSTAVVAAATYEPAGEALRVGGDWYTTTALPDGRTGVSVGDVAGHGLAAAAVMSRLRSALVTAALAEHDPAAVLRLLDRYTRTLSGEVFATAAYAIIDTGAGSVEYSCAGHPYPLVVDADGQALYLRSGRRGPLGAKSPTPASAGGRGALPTGSLLLLYTDGLIERRGEPIDTGLDRLAAAAAGCALLPASRACAFLLAAMGGPDGYPDDVAMVAVRPIGSTPTSHIDALPADFAQMAPARARLRGWLRQVPVDPAEDGRILLCAGEALTNAIKHGSGCDPERTVTVEAFATPDGITVTISDTGHWTADSPAGGPADGGHGLAVIDGLADDVQIERTALGTRVTITCRAPHSEPSTQEE